MTSATDPPVLEVSGLRAEFALGRRVVQAVRGVSFSVARGARIGIVGESGSGKSAMALSIMGLLEPPGRVAGGSVKLAGRELAGLRDRELQRIRGREISLIYQDASAALDPVRSIGAQLIEAIRCHEPLRRAAARRRAIELLQDVEVPNAAQRLDDYPHQYSGGMRQRVVIACALAHQPSLIIADEPTTALDVTTQAQVLELLARLVDDRGSAVILISHNLGVIAGFCDSVRVMYAGRFVEEASSRMLFATPRHPYTAALLDAVPRPRTLRRGPLAAIGGTPPDLAALGPACAFEPRCPRADGRAACKSEFPVIHEINGQLAECHFPLEVSSESEVHP